MTHPPADSRPVTSTYRLQLHANFGFADAAEILAYLADLGVSHVYLSPVLTAMPASMHCYDVVDHQQINPELGGEDGLRQLAERAHEVGLGLVVDIVPNHMALAAPQWRNAQAWQVLHQGPTSATAHWFDVDWQALDGRFGMPVLGTGLDEALAAGELVLDVGRAEEGLAAGEPVIRYYDHVFPVASGTLRGAGDPTEPEGEADLSGSDDVAVVLERQHYRLASWRESDDVLNYRRFFEVDTLLAVRVEEPDVFEATHAKLLALHHDGIIDGFRVDHPDGLHDPGRYLQQLRAAMAPGAPVWVEKILEGEEPLPADWACAGTTGYDANAVLSLALVDPSSAQEISRAWARVGGTPDLADVVDACKYESVDDLLGPEVARLLRRASEALPHLDPESLRAGLRELLVAMEVYRAYVVPGQPTSPRSAQTLHTAISRACAAAPEHQDAIEALGAILTDPRAVAAADGGGDTDAAGDLCVRYQQTTGPVMAKSVEDTAFYRWHRLIALNEVGVSPSHAAHPDLRALHEWAQHQQSSWPGGMSTLSTHDTKRSEDIRARLFALAGDATCWQECRKVAYKQASGHGLDGPVVHLIWQTLAGVGPISAQRLSEYLIKAVREAKVHTTWIEPNTEYEARVLQCAEQARTGGDLHDAIERAVQASSQQIRATVLAQKLVQLTLPGVPDTYQGSEVLDLSLVDPDNRRPVDYHRRAQTLAEIDADLDVTDLDAMKLLVTARALRLRRARPEVFGADGSYRPLHAGKHLIGFVRAEQVATMALRAPHQVGVTSLNDERVDLTAGIWQDELTHHRFEVGPGGLMLAEAFMDAPVALLVLQESE